MKFFDIEKKPKIIQAKLREFLIFFLIPKIIMHRYDEDCAKVNPNSVNFGFPIKKLKYILANSGIWQIL